MSPRPNKRTVGKIKAAYPESEAIAKLATDVARLERAVREAEEIGNAACREAEARATRAEGERDEARGRVEKYQDERDIAQAELAHESQDCESLRDGLREAEAALSECREALARIENSPTGCLADHGRIASAALTATERKPRTKECPDCNGVGQTTRVRPNTNKSGVPAWDTGGMDISICSTCNGAGTVPTERGDTDG